MASNTLSGAGASPANTKAQLLHIGTGNLAAGAVIRLGEGTGTILTLSTAALAVGGNISATGSLTTGGPVLVTGVQNLTGAGEIDLSHAVTLFTSTAGAQLLTLEDGTHGQIKTIIHAADGGSGVLTPTTKTGFNTITFTYVGDTVTLQFITGLGWIVLGSFVTTFA